MVEEAKSFAQGPPAQVGGFGSPGASVLTHLLVVGLQATHEHGVAPGRRQEKGSVETSEEEGAQSLRVMWWVKHKAGFSAHLSLPTSPSFPPDPEVTAGTWQPQCAPCRVG